jgi:hypothetical protein
MPNVQHKRGTRAALNALAAGNGLLVGQLYIITDESRIAVATAVNAYTAYVKEGEGGGGGGGGATITTVEVNFTTAARERFFNIAHAGATVGQKVIATPSLDMPAGVAMDELETDPLTVAAAVVVANQVRLLVASARGGLISGKRNINYQLV